jgi:hypothetical protein
MPLQMSAQGYLPSFFNYIEAICLQAAVEVNAVYSKSFFMAAFMTSLLAIQSWSTSPQTANIAILPAQIFHVYSLIPCLTEYMPENLLFFQQGGITPPNIIQ